MGIDTHRPQVHSDNGAEIDDLGVSESIRLSFVGNNLVERSALNDYALRILDDSNQHLSFVNFCVDTREIAVWAVIDETSFRNTRIRYSDPHLCATSRCRIMRNEGHRYLPSFIGASFPSLKDTRTPEDKIVYYATMLVLFKPWRRWEDVMQWSADWEGTYSEFVEMDSHARSCILNTFLHTQHSACAGVSQCRNGTYVDGS